MNKQPVKENSFEAGVGGTAGISNTQGGYGTFSSPAVAQNSANFVNGNQNKAVNQNSNTAKDAPDSGSIDRNLNAIYAQKDTPTPDEIVTGIKYELGQQIKKDRRLAKEKVVANLRKDPHYYGKLKMLNIDDESMVNNMTENKHPNDSAARSKVSANPSETKKIFEDLAKQKDNKFVVNSNIVDAMRQTWDAKKKRNDWRSGK